MSDDHDDIDARYGAEPARSRAGSRPGPTLFALIGLLVGVAAGMALAWSIGGNPFSDANEVRYLEVVVANVDASGGRLCWSEDPERRDADQQCAILALDPELGVPEAGELVTIGLVDLRTPGGTEPARQVVHVGPPPGVDLIVPQGPSTEDLDG